MATKKSIWILIGLVAIMAWTLGSATQASAKTYTMKCRETGQQGKVNVIEVGDVPGHIVAVGEQTGVLSCDDGSIATTSTKFMTDQTKGSGKAYYYWMVTYEDGSTTCSKGINTLTTNPDGKTVKWEFTGEYIMGTGRFQGIQGSASGAGKRLTPTPGPGAQFYYDSTITYTLPSK